MSVKPGLGLYIVGVLVLSWVLGNQYHIGGGSVFFRIFSGSQSILADTEQYACGLGHPADWLVFWFL